MFIEIKCINTEMSVAVRCSDIVRVDECESSTRLYFADGDFVETPVEFKEVLSKLIRFS